MKKTVAVLILILCFLFGVPVYTTDAGRMGVLVETRYFTVHSEQSMDVSHLLAILDMNYFLQFDRMFDDDQTDLRHLLAKTVDAVFEEVSDILGVKVFDFNGTIKIFPDHAVMAEALRQVYSTQLDDASYFAFETNTIYISLDDMTLGMFGHEVAHAIISSYFVVPPPPRIQEVLSGYVEYKLTQ